MDPNNDQVVAPPDAVEDCHERLEALDHFEFDLARYRVDGTSP